MRDIWNQHRKWIIVAAALLAVAVVIAVVGLATPPLPRTEAEPPVESEVTFDMEKNRAYTAEDGIVVIPASELKIENVELRMKESPAAMIQNDREAAPSLSIINSQLSTKYTLPEDAQMADRECLRNR